MMPASLSLAAFADPLALAIIGGGTALALVLRTPRGDLVRAIHAVRVLPRPPFDGDAAVEQVTMLDRIARRHGVVALDRSRIHDPDIAAAVTAIVDREGGEAVRALLVERREARVDRHLAAAEVWSALADIAPAMGMVGTLIGLVRMFMGMTDPATIGAAMAVALLTTLYGAVIATLIANPIAGRLRRLARIEASGRTRIEAPLAALAHRERPRLAEIGAAA